MKRRICLYVEVDSTKCDIEKVVRHALTAATEQAASVLSRYKTNTGNTTLNINGGRVSVKWKVHKP